LAQRCDRPNGKGCAKIGVPQWVDRKFDEPQGHFVCLGVRSAVRGARGRAGFDAVYGAGFGVVVGRVLDQRPGRCVRQRSGAQVDPWRTGPALDQQWYFRGPGRAVGSIGAHMSRIDDSLEFIPVRIAVLTVSDTRGLADDRSGDVLVGRIADGGHTLVQRAIIQDERHQIADQLRVWCADPGIDVVISTGGTGLTGRDVTVEAHRDVYEKEIDAFGTIFTIVSMQKIGTSAVQSRATAGVAQGTYLFALPGSPGACKDAWDEILVKQLDFRHRPCNFVEIMPRLDEHQRRK